jgi:hypothetical protein
VRARSAAPLNKTLGLIMLRHALLILAIAGAPLCALAASDDHVHLMGIGSNSCGKWLEAKDSASARAIYRSWILGFITGANWHAGSTKQASVPDAAASMAYIDRYCANNPLHIVGLAAAALVQDAGGAKAVHQWKK